MTPREIDALVAEKVMGWKVCHANTDTPPTWWFDPPYPGTYRWRPSEDISAAMEVVERLWKQGYKFRCELFEWGWKVGFLKWDDPEGEWVEGGASTLSMAICLAALLIREVSSKGEEVS